MSEIFWCTYVATLINGEKHPRRTGPFGEEAATALAREVSRRPQISEVYIEKWTCTERTEVRA